MEAEGKDKLILHSTEKEEIITTIGCTPRKRNISYKAIQQHSHSQFTHRSPHS